MARTRPDAVATFAVEEADVTAWVPEAESGVPWMALAQVENASMRVHGLVALEDLRVLLTKPQFARPGYLPDGFTERAVVGVEADVLVLEVELHGLTTTTMRVPCSEASVMPTDDGFEALLPDAQGEVVVKADAQIHVGDDSVRAGDTWLPSGVARVDGKLAELRARPLAASSS